MIVARLSVGVVGNVNWLSPGTDASWDFGNGVIPRNAIGSCQVDSVIYCKYIMSCFCFIAYFKWWGSFSGCRFLFTPQFWPDSLSPSLPSSHPLPFVFTRSCVCSCVCVCVCVCVWMTRVGKERKKKKKRPDVRDEDAHYTAESACEERRAPLQLPTPAEDSIYIYKTAPGAGRLLSAKFDSAA